MVVSICPECLGSMLETVKSWYKCVCCGYCHDKNEENLLVKKEKKMFKVSSLEEAKARYGEILDNKWADEGKWMAVMKIPDFFATWINTATGKPTTKIYCNKDMVDPLGQVLNNIRDRGLLRELKTFDGCFSIRDVRGIPGQPSCHSYGLAIDINAKENALGKDPVISQELVKCFTDVGFAWGGNFKRKDGMHFSRAWEN